MSAEVAAPISHRGEFGALMRLGTPIIVAQLFQMGNGLVDTLMAGRYSAQDLAGVALAWSVVGAVMILIMGVIHALTPIVAQLYGAGRESEIGAEVRQGVWVAVFTATVGMLIAANVGSVFGLLGAEPEVVAVSAGYVDAVLWGYLGFGFYFVLRHTCEGMGRTRPAMIVAGIMLCVNAVLNYAFIYGRFGAPELGGVGCGVATAIINWLQFLAMLVVVTRPFYRRARIFDGSWRIDPGALKRFAAIGVPIGVTAFFEMGLYSLVTVLLARFGAEVVAAHSIAMHVNGLVWVVPLSVGIAASIRVGHSVGAGAYETARVSGEAAVRASLVYAAVIAVVLTLLRYEIAALFSTDARVVEIAANVIVFVAAYQFVDDTQVTGIGVLRGYKDTRVPMVYALVGYWVVALPVALGFGYGVGFEGWGIYGFWIGLSVGLAVVAVAVNVRRVRLARDPGRIERMANALT